MESVLGHEKGKHKLKNKILQCYESLIKKRGVSNFATPLSYCKKMGIILYMSIVLEGCCEFLGVLKLEPSSSIEKPRSSC